MHALEREPEARHRWYLITTAAAVVLSVEAAGLVGASRMDVPARAKQSERVHVAVVHRAPKPSPAPPPLDPPPPAPPPPLPALAPKKELPKVPAPAVAAPAVVVHSVAPPPLVVGLTLSSTTQGGRGPQVAVGNTLLGRPEPVARAPVSGAAEAARPPAPLDGEVTALGRSDAKILQSEDPSYPEQAKREGIEGVVVLSITINTQGLVEDAVVLSGLGAGLDESALAAVRRTRWAPATINGKPVRTTRRFNVRFTLQG